MASISPLPSRHRWRRIRALLAVCTSLGLPASFTHSSAYAGDLTYIYDDLGRLVATVDGGSSDPLGGVALYAYDAVGNVLSLTRQPTSQLSIIEFAPKCGSAGTPIAVWGTGYSSTPAQNTVTVGGTAASVTSATPTKLVISAPSGASGPLVVTTPTGSTTSSRSFTAGTCA